MLVNFYATLRPIAGGKRVEFAFPENTTVKGLLSAVVERFPSMRRELLDDEGELYAHVHVFVNGRDAPYLDNATSTVIRPGDRVDIFPAVGGGAEVVGYDRTMCGIPIWLLREYLEEIGGSVGEDGHVRGEGWVAELTQLQDFGVGSLVVGQVRLEVRAEQRTWKGLQPVLEKKLLRAGG